MVKLSAHDETDLTQFLQKLVQTASFTGMEGAVAQLVTAEMERAGFDAVSVDEMGNVIGQIGSGEPPFLLFWGQMDTVGIGDIAAWQRDPFGGVIENGVLYGRGAANPKAALASMIYGAKQFKAENRRFDGTLLVVAAVNGELAEGSAARFVFERLPVLPRWVVLGAATNLDVHIGQRGRLEIEVTVQGKACHASTPEWGVNAIYGAAKIIFSLELMRSMLMDDPFLGAGSLAVTHIENIERTKNVIPDRCNFVIDRRLTMGETEAHALAEIQSVLAKEAVEGDIRVANFHAASYTGKFCDERKSYPAWIMDERDPLVRRVSKVVQPVLGHKPKLGHWRFSTAGVYTMGYAGVPTVGFAPGDERLAHTAADQVSLRDCFRAAAGYVAIAEELLGG